MKTLKYAQIDTSDYFDYLLSGDISRIAADLKKAHEKDVETADPENMMEETLKSIDELQVDESGYVKNAMMHYGKILKMNFTKMDPYELKTFTEIIEKYSMLFKNTGGNRARGKRK